jgi:membrane dipeptidase
MQRRDFLIAAGFGTALSALGRERSSALADDPRSAYDRALVIDALAPDGPFLDVDAAVKAGITGAIVDMSMYPRNYANGVAALGQWNALFRRDPRLVRVTRGEQILQAKRSKKLAIILACQDAAILDASTISVNRQNLDNLAMFYDLGLRVLQLTHNDRNSVGDSFREKTDAGLSRLGEEVVPAMNQLRMLVDLSHCSRLTTLQAIELSTRPCAITHAGCKALHPTARNKTDEEMRAVARKGGFFGVFNMSLWLTRKQTTSIDDVLDHIDHAVKLAGIDHVGFGSDGPVVRNPSSAEASLAGMRGYYQRNQGLPGAEDLPYHVNVEELKGPDRLERLAFALGKRGYSDDAIEKIVGGNIARVITEVLG